MKKKDIDAVYEENPAEDATAEEKASGKKKKSKKKKIKTEQASESRKEQNKVFAKASYFFVLMFLSLCAYLVYFNIADRETINSSSYNTKQDNKDTMRVALTLMAGYFPMWSVMPATDVPAQRLLTIRSLLPAMLLFLSRSKMRHRM